MIDTEYLRDLFAMAEPLSFRRMFGGMAIYSDGTIFAVVTPDGLVRVKGDSISAVDYDARGMTRWTYQRDGSDKITAMPYWQVPDEAFDDPDLMAQLVTIALAAARRS